MPDFVAYDEPEVGDLGAHRLPDHPRAVSLEPEAACHCFPGFDHPLERGVARVERFAFTERHSEQVRWLPLTYGVAVSGARIQVAAVDDHPVLLLGVVAATVATGEVSFAGTAGTVSELLADAPAADVVLLDLLLRDSSRPRDNVQALIAAGYDVLLFTEGDRVTWIADAMRAGARGVVTKAQSSARLLEAIRAVHAGETVLTPEMAAALHRDSVLRPRLTEREREALCLVGQGLADKQAARAMGIAEDTLKEYLKRIRAKYAESGRPAASRVELHHRATEDGYLRDDWPDSGG